MHLSAGDLLRAERNRKDSPVAELINTYIVEGKIVPMEITVHLIKEAMKKAYPEFKHFLIDGFPREIQQGATFEKEVCLHQSFWLATNIPSLRCAWPRKCFSTTVLRMLCLSAC